MSSETPASRRDAAQSGDARLDALLNESEQLCNEKQYDKAIARLQDTVEQFPASPLPHHALSVVYLMRLRDNYQHQEVWEDLADDEAHFETAVQEAEAALNLDENFVPSRNNLGTLFALRGWWEDAIQQWDISLTLEPEQPQVREELAEAHEHLGE